MTIAEYNEREQKAKASSSARLLQMVGTMMFDAEGYTSRVSAGHELWKYADAMHETRFDGILNGLLGGVLSSAEFDLLKSAVAVTQVACVGCGCPHLITPRGSLLRAVFMWRHLSPLVGRVFEIGPGSGHLGTLLMASGRQYGATENAQGFFLWQQELWRASKMTPVCHLPWWEFYGLTIPNLPKVDVVTCNHALAELHPFALRFVLGAALSMLDKNGLFAFEGFGSERFQSRAAIEATFALAGFVRVQESPITIFALSRRPISQVKQPHNVTKAQLDAFYAGIAPSPDEQLLGLLGMFL